jgi:hypothetical protein
VEARTEDKKTIGKMQCGSNRGEEADIDCGRDHPIAKRDGDVRSGRSQRFHSECGLGAVRVPTNKKEAELE